MVAMKQKVNDPQFYEGQDLEALADLPRYTSWILKTFTPYLQGRVLEVGAGTGNFAAHYVDSVEEVVLLEPAQNLRPTLARRFAQKPHVQIHSGRLEDWYPRLARERLFDAVLMVNVLEHIEDDQGTVDLLARLLRPGGKLLVFVPALSWLYGSLDRLVHHHRRYSWSQLARIMDRAGLELEHLRFFDSTGVLPWLMAGRVLLQQRFSHRAAHLYDRAVVPVTAWLEQKVSVPLGKNLICAATRPAKECLAA